jgi:antitoxin component YwqK of YwqJK toxin-antitoxin module
MEKKYTGLYKDYHSNGNKSYMCEYKDGKKNGIFITYYFNGKIKTIGQFSEDKPIGYWKHFNKDTTIEKEYQRSWHYGAIIGHCDLEGEYDEYIKQLHY